MSGSVLVRCALALGVSLVMLASATAGNATRFVVAGRGARAVAYPALASAQKKAPIVYLHGICGAPDRGCDALAAEATRFGPFVCPRANTACGANNTWSGDPFKQLDTVDRAMDLVAEQTRGALDVGRAGILVGFSQGAYAAVPLVLARPGRFRALLLVGANVHIEPKRLLAAGVTRVVLAAGQFDGTHAAMRKIDAGLQHSGLESRFVDLGPVGHTYEPSIERTDAMHDAWTWLDEADEVAD